MIPYRKIFWGLHLPLRCYGSPVLQTAVFGVLAALQTVLLYEFWGEKSKQYFSGVPYLTFPAYTTMVTFLIVFRQSFSSSRYDNGRTRLQTMTSSLWSAFSLALSFDGGSKTWIAQGEPLDAASESFRNDMAHRFSLLHASCLQTLRCDWDFNNLTDHNEDDLPPWDSSSTQGFTVPLWNYVLPRSRVRSRARYHQVSKLPVIGGLTKRERTVLSSRAAVRVQTRVRQRRGGSNGDADKSFYNPSVILESKSVSGGTAKYFQASSLWTSDTGVVVRGAMERPYRILFWIKEGMRHRMVDGGLDMPAPILATIWQSINAAVQNFELATSLNDTPFPFPWAQLIVFALITWQILIPFTVVVSYQNRALGIVTSVVTVWVLWALNEVARDIEDPFLSEPNDLPLARLQYQFNQRLLAVINYTEGYAEFLAETSGSAEKMEDGEIPSYAGGVMEEGSTVVDS